MKIVFFGTGSFGVPALKRLLGSAHEVVAVVTQPDKKKGRGWSVMPTQVKAAMEQIAPAMDILQPEKISDGEFIAAIRGMDPDIFVVVDYGRILGEELLDVPRKYCINLHPSLLPEYRGASPVNKAILNGDEETGNTIIRMNLRMDAGSIIMQEKVRIGAEEDAVMLEERLSQNGAELLLKALEKIEAGREEFLEQDEAAATYAPRLTKKDGRIDWARAAIEIDRQVKGLVPWPGAFTFLDGKVLKIHKAGIISGGGVSAPPGSVIDANKLIVKAGQGDICIKKLQLEGKKTMSAESFLKGYPLNPGTVLG